MNEMSPDQRVDYFRSEIKGEMSKLEKRMTDQFTEVRKRLEESERRCTELTRALRDLEMMARG